MGTLKSHLKTLQSCLKAEIHSIKKLKGEDLELFKDIFNLDKDYGIYYNEYNLIITDSELREKLQFFFKKGSLLITIEIPSHNVNIWVYQYINDQIFSSYLP